jgi:hypothetical protein
MISGEQLATVISEFRSACLKRYPDDIQLLTDRERDERFGHVLSEPSDYLYTIANQPIDQLCRLLKAPRLLKTVLRQVLHIWDDLHGELDFDDLLVSMAIRFTAPEAFDFLLENFRAIRTFEREGVGNTKQERTKQIEAKWGRLVNAEWDAATVKTLISFLFPMWEPERIRTRHGSPQGVAVAAPTDYWLRALAGSLSSGEIRDQEVLRAIKRWLTGVSNNHFRETTLAAALNESEEFAAKFEQFAQRILDGQKLRDLASTLFEDILVKNGVTANHESGPGFIRLWRCAIRKPIDTEAHRLWIEQEIARYFSRSLRFANDLYYYWRSNREMEIEGPRHFIELRQRVVERAKEIYQGDAEKLISVLDPSFMYSAFHFVVLFSSEKEGGPGFHAEDWKWFRDLLLQAAELAPETLIPQLAVFVCKEKMQLGGFESHFSEEDARQFFTDRYDDLLQLLTWPIDITRFSDRDKNLLEIARKAARTLLGLAND